MIWRTVSAVARYGERSPLSHISGGLRPPKSASADEGGEGGIWRRSAFTTPRVGHSLTLLPIRRNV